MQQTVNGDATAERLRLATMAASNVASANHWSEPALVSYGTNVVFKAAGAQGNWCAIKVGRAAEANLLEDELRLAQELLSQGVSLVRPYDRSVLYAAVEGAEPLPVSLWHWEAGTHAPAGNASFRHLGKTLRHLHSSKVANAPNNTHHAPLRLAQRWKRLHSAILANPDHPWHNQPAILAEVAVAGDRAWQKYRQLSGLSPQVFGHGDLNNHNVLLSPGRAVLLDLGFAGTESQHCDFARLTCNAIMGKYTPHHLAQVCRGYESPPPPRSEIAGFGTIWQVTHVLWRAEGVDRGTCDVQTLEQELQSLRKHPDGRPSWFAACEIFPDL